MRQIARVTLRPSEVSLFTSSDLNSVKPFPGIAEAALILPQGFVQTSRSRNNPYHLRVSLLIWLSAQDSGRLEYHPAVTRLHSPAATNHQIGTYCSVAYT